MLGYSNHSLPWLVLVPLTLTLTLTIPGTAKADEGRIGKATDRGIVLHRELAEGCSI